MGLIRIKDWTHFTLLTPVIETVDLTLRSFRTLKERHSKSST